MEDNIEELYTELELEMNRPLSEIEKTIIKRGYSRGKRDSALHLMKVLMPEGTGR